MTYALILLLLFVAELTYFAIAARCNIIDKPNQRSSHTKIVLRGGGIIFVVGVWVWALAFGFQYPWFIAATTIVAAVSFVDDIHSLPPLLRLLTQFVCMAMMFYQVDMFQRDLWWLVILAFIVCVGAANIYNFMDGVNGITGLYSLGVILPLFALNRGMGIPSLEPFVAESLMVVSVLSIVVFGVFNFRPKDRARCFAGDVGSMGMAFIVLFLMGNLVVRTKDLTWFLLLAVYGIDGFLTIVHRLMLRENPLVAHRKHAFQLLSNELGWGHLSVSLLYMGVQLLISAVMIFVLPDTPLAHWTYLVLVMGTGAAAYIVFMRRYYHLHAAYLRSQQQKP